MRINHFRLIIAFFALLLFSQNAYAYLDPGTGSIIIQALIAALFGSVFFIKNIFHSIKFYISKLTGSKKPEVENNVVAPVEVDK